MSRSSELSLLKTARMVIQHCSRSFYVLFITTLIPSVALSENICVDQYCLEARLALTTQEQEKGLQGVEHLADNEGMLFVFNPPRPVCMWMKDVPIDLEVGFFDENGRLMAVRQMKAQTENTHCAPSKAAWALEVNQGWFEKKRLTKGAKLKVN